MRSLTLEAREWPLHEPFRIAREVMTHISAVYVVIREGGFRGHAEAIGIPYVGETPQTICAQIESIRTQVEHGLDRRELLKLLPVGGARNALDCALWDLEAKKSRRPVWQAIGEVGVPRSVQTAFTLGIMDESSLRGAASAVRDYPVLKVKTDAFRGLDPARIIHEIAPAAKLIVDANQSWSLAQLERYSASAAQYNVCLFEQPLPTESDHALSTIRLSVPIAADESFTDAQSLSVLRGRYDVFNLKLDKTGGLTAALDIIRDPDNADFDFMIGCMAGSSLAMAPAFIIAQYCTFVDLDGPLLHSADVAQPLDYDRGRISAPSPALWG